VHRLITILNVDNYALDYMEQHTSGLAHFRTTDTRPQIYRNIFYFHEMLDKNVASRRDEYIDNLHGGIIQQIIHITSTGFATKCKDKLKC